MYKIISIAALTAGMLLLTQGAQAAPMNVEVTNGVPAADMAQRGRQTASSRANSNASFNRSVPTAVTTSGNTSLHTTVSGSTVTAVPEPGTLGLFAAAIIGAGIVRRRRAH